MTEAFIWIQAPYEKAIEGRKHLLQGSVNESLISRCNLVQVPSVECARIDWEEDGLDREDCGECDYLARLDRRSS